MMVTRSRAFGWSCCRRLRDLQLSWPLIGFSKGLTLTVPTLWPRIIIIYNTRRRQHFPASCTAWPKILISRRRYVKNWLEFSWIRTLVWHLRTWRTFRIGVQQWRKECDFFQLRWKNVMETLVTRIPRAQGRKKLFPRWWKMPLKAAEWNLGWYHLRFDAHVQRRFVLWKPWRLCPPNDGWSSMMKMCAHIPSNNRSRFCPSALALDSVKEGDLPRWKLKFFSPASSEPIGLIAIARIWKS